MRKLQVSEIGITKAMLVLGHAAAEAGLLADQALLDQPAHRLLHDALIQCHYRIAAAFLIAGIGQSVERQRILIGSGNFLLYQTSYDPRLIGCKLKIQAAFLSAYIYY
jgi:hypothetical protein